MATFKLVYFDGCPNVQKARDLLEKAGVPSCEEIRQDDLEDGHPLRQVSSPAIVHGDRIVIGQSTCAEGGACTFPFSTDDEAVSRLKQELRKGKDSGPALKAAAGVGGSLTVLAFIGGCAGGCSLMAAPIAGLLTSVGLGVLAPWVPSLRLPLLAVAVIFAALTVIRLSRLGFRIRAVATAILLGSAIAGSYLATRSESTIQGTALYLRSLSPEAQELVRTGIYRTWLQLGRAPTLDEVRAAVAGLGSERIARALQEIRSTEFSEMFEPGTDTIRWFWPLSSQNHGITVALSGEKPVFARCAVDALGMSKMFGKPATIHVRTPLWKKEIEFSMREATLTKADSAVVVSRGESCDDLLFFASSEEFELFKEKSGRQHLKKMSLSDAIRWGLASFGSIFEDGRQS